MILNTISLPLQGRADKKGFLLHGKELFKISGILIKALGEPAPLALVPW
jgi:hypothetical protein